MGLFKSRPEHVDEREPQSSATQVRDLLARIAAADEVLRVVADEQLVLERDDRNHEVFNLVFDLRRALGIPPDGLPAPQVRSSVPYVPGRQP